MQHKDSLPVVSATPPSAVSHYLYVPFISSELSDEVIADIEDFKKGGALQRKEYTILYHSYCDLSQLEKNAKVFVLGHGIDLSPDRKLSVAIRELEDNYELVKHLPYSDWSYSISGGAKAISIDTVAQRMIFDGLLKSDQINIKLWFCDENHKAYFMAKRFLDNFENITNDFRVDYYFNKLLRSPRLINGKRYKAAYDPKTSQSVKASSIKQSLFSRQDLHKDEILKSIATPAERGKKLGV